MVAGFRDGGAHLAAPPDAAIGELIGRGRVGTVAGARRRTGNDGDDTAPLSLHPFRTCLPARACRQETSVAEWRFIENSDQGHRYAARQAAYVRIWRECGERECGDEGQRLRLGSVSGVYKPEKRPLAGRLRDGSSHLREVRSAGKNGPDAQNAHRR